MKPLVPIFEEKNIPIVIASNETYLPYASVLLTSLLSNTSSKYNYCVFLLHEGKLAEIEILADQVNSHVNASFFTIDVTHRFEKLHLPTHSHITRATYYRLCLPGLFKNFNRILYLDIDTLIQDDVGSLFNTNLKGQAIGACLDLGQRIWSKEGKKLYYPYYKGSAEGYLKEYLGLRKPQNYFQAGVLLLNLRKLRLDHTEDKFFSIIRLGKQLHWMDQDILNIVFNRDGFHILDLRWNFIELDKVSNYDPEITTAYEEARRNPAIIHYASANKPWFNPQGELNSLWWKTAKMTPFYQKIEEKRLSHERHQKYLTSRLKGSLTEKTFLGRMLRNLRSWFTF